MGANSVQSSSQLSLVVVLHLIFSIVTFTVLSYKVYFQDNDLTSKVYFLEKELFSVRKEISALRLSNGISEVQSIQMPTSTSAVRGNQSSSYGSGRYRRAGKKDAGSSKDQIKEECLEKMLNDLKV